MRCETLGLAFVLTLSVCLYSLCIALLYRFSFSEELITRHRDLLTDFYMRWFRNHEAKKYLPILPWQEISDTIQREPKNYFLPYIALFVIPLLSAVATGGILLERCPVFWGGVLEAIGTVTLVVLGLLFLFTKWISRIYVIRPQELFEWLQTKWVAHDRTIRMRPESLVMGLDII